MNAMKHMEMIFALVVTASLLLAAAADRNASAADGSAAPASATIAATVEQHIASADTMAVVIVKGRRLSSREKRRAALSDGDLRIF